MFFTLTSQIEFAGWSCRLNISHLSIFSLKPAALENWLMESNTQEIGFHFFKNVAALSNAPENFKSWAGTMFQSYTTTDFPV